MNMETGRILGGHITSRGFPAYSEHRISHYVADAWLGRKKPGYEVRHKNNDICDNRPANLYFYKTSPVTPKPTDWTQRVKLSVPRKPKTLPIVPVDFKVSFD